MKRPQWITAGVAVFLLLAVYFFGRTVPIKKNIVTDVSHEGVHDHDNTSAVTIDTILVLAKKQLTADQVTRLNELEHSISRGDVMSQQLSVYHRLSHFWSDSAKIFEPYAWYEAEAARLENSEKSLTFAAHLFLENLQVDEVIDRRKWKAMQAKDLFERSLKINPDNDSSKVGLGATLLFGQVSETPMEGIMKIREVAERDTTNVYAQYTLAKASVISGQYDKAISRLESVNRLDPGNLDAMLMLADVFERTGKKDKAIEWYRASLKYVKAKGLKEGIEERISQLQK